MPERGSGRRTRLRLALRQEGAKPAAERFRGPRAHPGDAEDRPAGDRGRAPPAGARPAAPRRSRRSPCRRRRSPRPSPGDQGPREPGRRSAGQDRPAPPRGLARVPGRRAALGLEQDREGRHRPDRARPAEQPGTTYLLVGSDSRKGLSAAENKRLGTGGVGDVGQRTDTIMLLHTGDGPEPAALHPPRLARRHPRPRHHQDQLGLRHRRPQAAGAHHRAEHRRAHRRLRRDRLRRLRELRRRRRRDHGLPDAADGRPRGQPAHQEGLPGGRRGHRRSATRAPATSASTATSTAPATSARWSARSARR